MEATWSSAAGWPSGRERTMAGRLRRRMALVALLRVFKPGTPGVGRRLAAVPRMIAATLRGQYDGRWRLATMGLAAVYLVSPLDLIADAVFLIVGVIGDAGLVTWLAGALLDETERFLVWERQCAVSRYRPSAAWGGAAAGSPRPEPRLARGPNLDRTTYRP